MIAILRQQSRLRCATQRPLLSITRPMASIQTEERSRSRQLRLDRAKGYPYPRPPSSFVYAEGKSFPFDNSLWKDESSIPQILDKYPDKHARRTAVLAIGSNASPEQLQRKYGDKPSTVMPVVQGVLRDFDVVYIPAVVSYGSCTATLQYSPGALMEVFVTYLTDEQLDDMIKTEASYDLVRLKNIDLKMGISVSQFEAGIVGQQSLESVFQFNCQLGCLTLPLSEESSPSPISLAAIPAISRKFQALSQEEMLARIKELMGEDNLDAWIEKCLDDRAYRMTVIDRLSAWTEEFKYKDIEFISRIGDIYSDNVK